MTLPARAFGWKYDLPDPATPSDFRPVIEEFLAPPSHIDSIYIELPRSIFKIRGYDPIVGGSILLVGLITLISFIYNDFTSTTKADAGGLLIFAASYAFVFFFIFAQIRMDLTYPRNEPIRFNRLRQRVYFYQYRHDQLHPFGWKNWGVKPVAYDWEQLTAEVYSVYSPMGYGGRAEKVMISVRKPGTDEVIDRVFFAGNIEQGKKFWALARIFMQEGPDALPAFTHAPTDWNSDDLRNPFHRLAPKVQWPPEMDLESRTAPGQGEQP
ncbi:DUF6708 domain-containing protein [Pseudomonas sp. NPDC089758]|uniref:DUF6708 domain-containing protein n=1 Tax=Pseudomonas sp. NPDC089758 TaxID=3364473 RepID=UPI0037FA4E20